MSQFFEVIHGQNGEQTIRYYGQDEVDALKKTTLEADAKEVRSKRDALISSCDWTQLPDAPVDQTAWAVYRQALRDITDQEGFPSSVVWPVPPT